MSAFRVWALLLTGVVSMGLMDGSSPKKEARAPAPPDSPAIALNKMPVRFEANAGQLDERVRFVARRGTAALFLGDEGATLSIQQRLKQPNVKGAAAKHEVMEMRADRVVIGLKPAGARKVTPRATNELVTKTNYFIGDDPSKWHTNVPTYATVTYPSVLDGVDLVYHGENGALEYDFVVNPGASVDSVAMNVEGATGVSLTSTGDLAIHTYAGDIVQPAPVVYQRDANGVKHTLTSSYQIVGKTSVGFKVSSYDRAKPLVIDPVLGFATYLGGSGYDDVVGIVGDAAGNTYVTGATTSADFPTVSAYDPTYNTYIGCPQCGYRDVFIAKLDATGANVLYATYLGGTSHDNVQGIALDAANNAYVTGYTESYDFPSSSPLALNTQRWGQYDAFVARIGPDGTTLPYATLLVGTGNDQARGIAVDGTGIYIGGTTSSLDLTAPNPEGGPRGGPQGGASGGYDDDAFVLKLTPAGNAVTYLKYLGGATSDYGNGLAIDAAGNAYLVGTTFSSDFPTLNPAQATCLPGEFRASADAFIVKLNANGNTTYATCLGGMNYETGLAIAADPDGNAYVTGETTSTDFPAPSSLYPFAGGGESTTGFVTKLNAAGSAFVYSTFLAGSDGDRPRAIAVDSARTAWVTGLTSSAAFPTVQPVQATYANGGADAFVTRINAAGSALIFSSFYGGSIGFDGAYDSGTAIAVNGSSIHLGGSTYSTNLPVFNAKYPTNAGQNDGFVAKLSVPPLLISPPSVLVPVGSGQQFTAIGGAGFGYVFTLQTNGSNGSITPTGAYSAGVNGGAVDVVLVTDASGLTASATVQVGANTPALVISPTNTSVPPKGVRGFTGGGGVPPYSFSFASNASGGSVSPSGSYTAGIKGGVTDIVRLTDSVGTNVTAVVSVGAALKITPATPAAPPKGDISFTATGGSNGGYTWSITKNGSGGSIVPATGKYSAGNGSSTVDTVQVTDSLGNKAVVNVSVGGGLAVTPADPSTTTRGTIAFTAVGGSGSFNWALTSSPSGGTVTGSGVYTAGTTGNVVDTVKVTDTVGNSSAVQITVGPSLTISPPAASTLAGGTVAFGAAGGSGSYSFALVGNQSGGGVDANGVYTAGTNAGSDTVRLSDSLGSTADAVVTVSVPPPPGTPGTGTGGFDAGTIPGLNLGGGGANDDCSCRAVGSSSDASGTYRGVAGLALVLGLVARRRRRTLH